jgi:hypothetical protein
MAKPQNAVYAPGEDQASRDANLAYQDALNKLTESLDKRKNRLFDPTWLAISQGFLKPGTSNFFESLGNVAENIGKVQESLIKEDQDIAQQRLDVAGRGVELQRQKAKDAMVRRFLSGEEEPPPSAGALPATSRSQTGEPSGALPARGALAQAAAQDATASDMGFQLFPGIPGISRRQFFSLGLADGKNISDIAKEWEAIQRGRLQSKENYTVDTVTGRGFLLPNADTVQVQIFNRDGSTRTYPVTKSQAIRLSELAEKNDAEGYFALADRITRGPGTRPPAAQSPVAQGPAAQGPAAQQPPSLPSAPALSAPPVAPVPAAVSQPAAALPVRVATPPPPATSGVVNPPAQAGAQAGSTPFNPASLPPVAPAQVSAPLGGPQAAQAAAAAPVEPGSPEAIQKIQEFLRQRTQVAADGVTTRPPAASAAVVPPSAQGAAPPVVPQPAASAVAQAAPVAAAVQPAAPAAALPAAPARTSGLRSKEDIDAENRRIEVEQATAKARAEADVKSEIEAKAEISANAKKAREVTATANILRRISDRPDFSKMSGILSNDLFSSAMAMLARDGIGGKNISIGIPAIEDVMRNRRLNPEQQSQYRIFLMYASRMNLAAEDAMKGSTTERERLLLGNATISNQDTKETVRMKADLLNIKAQFDKRVANAFEDSKMNPKEFFRSEAYDKMYTNYLEAMEGVASGMMMLPSRGGAQPGAQRQGAPAQGRATGNTSAAGNRLRELINTPPQQRRP